MATVTGRTCLVICIWAAITAASRPTVAATATTNIRTRIMAPIRRQNCPATSRGESQVNGSYWLRRPRRCEVAEIDANGSPRAKFSDYRFGSWRQAGPGSAVSAASLRRHPLARQQGQRTVPCRPFAAWWSAVAAGVLV